MTDSGPYTAHHRSQPQDGPPSLLLFAFVRRPDHVRFRCELRFHGESLGWEVQFLRRAGLFISRRFPSRELAVRWARTMRREDLQKGTGV